MIARRATGWHCRTGPCQHVNQPCPVRRSQLASTTIPGNIINSQVCRARWQLARNSSESAAGAINAGSANCAGRQRPRPAACRAMVKSRKLNLLINQDQGCLTPSQLLRRAPCAAATAATSAKSTLNPIGRLLRQASQQARSTEVPGRQRCTHHQAGQSNC